MPRTPRRLRRLDNARRCFGSRQWLDHWAKDWPVPEGDRWIQACFCVSCPTNLGMLRATPTARASFGLVTWPATLGSVPVAGPFGTRAFLLCTVERLSGGMPEGLSFFPGPSGTRSALCAAMKHQGDEMA